MQEIWNKMQSKLKEAQQQSAAGEVEKGLETMKDYDQLRQQYELEKRLYEEEKQQVPDAPEKKGEQLTAEEKAFLDFAAGRNKELTVGKNGAIIPTSVANKIIDTVKERSPIFAMATKYMVAGNLTIPVYGDDSGDNIQAAYGTEFTDLTEHGGKFTAVTLNSLMIGALTKISKKLLNNTTLDVLAFVTNKLADAYADFMEKELLVGEGGSDKMTGATKTTNVITAAKATVDGITADLLIDAQLTVPQAYQANACWIMQKDVLKGLRKLKNTTGDYLLTPSLTQGFGWELLGKPVYVSDNMPAVAASAVPVLYGDFSGMAVKFSQELEIQTLVEKYATQHAIGVVGWAEADAKIENSQKFVGIKMAEG